LNYNLAKGHIHYLQAFTEDKKGQAQFTVDFVLRDLEAQGLLNSGQVRRVKRRMGLTARGGG